MNQSLKVKLEADVTNLQKGISDSERALLSLSSSISEVKGDLKAATLISRGYEKAQKDLAREFKVGTISQVQYDKGLKNLQRDERENIIVTKNLRTELSRLKRSYTDMGGSTKSLSKDVNHLGKSTNANAVPAMTSFSQVIQDAPYGIQGVANNIQQLTMQMGYLSRGAGGMNGALKAMVGSLVGPAGILLAVSVVTSLLVKYGDKLSFAASKTKELAKATADHMASAKTEIGTLKQLVEIANDYSQSIITRRNAIKEINDKYGDYLGNLDEEKLKTDEVKKAIDRLTLSLIHQAKIKGLDDLITEKTKDSAGELLELELKKRDAFRSVQQELKKLQGTSFFSKVIKDSNTVQENLDAVSKSTKGVDYAQLRLLKSAVAGYRGLKNEISEVQGETDKALDPLLSMQKDLRAQDLGFQLIPEFDQDDVVIKGGGGDGLGVPVRAEITPILSGSLIGDDFSIMMKNQIAEMTKLRDVFPEVSNGYRVIDDEVKRLTTRLNEMNGVITPDLSGLEGIGLKLQAEQDLYNAAIMDMASKSEEMGAIIAGGLGGAINDITNDLMNGELTLKSFAESIVGSLSKVLASLVQYSIMEAILGKAKQSVELGKSQANAITIASSAAASMGPLGIAALPGLLATTMGTIGGAFAGIQAFADGGIVQGSSYSGDKVLARLNSGELVLNKMQQKQMGAMMTPTMMMNNQPMEIYGETRIEGDAIVVAYKRSQAKNNRYS